MAQTILFRNQANLAIEGDVLAARIRTKVAAEWWGAYVLASPEMIKAETAIFMRPYRVGARVYSKATRNNAPDLGQSQRIEIKVDNFFIIRLEFDLMDNSFFQNGAFLMNHIVNLMTPTIIAHLDLVFFKELTNAVDANVAEYVEVLPNALTARTDVDIRANRLELKQKINEIRRTFNKQTMGVNGGELFILCDMDFKDLLIESIGIDASGQGAIQVLQNSNTSITTLQGGIKVIEHGYFGKNLPALDITSDANFAASLDEGAIAEGVTLDLTNYAAIVVTRGSIALVQSYQQLMTTTNPNSGNTNFLAKYNYGSGIVFPELIRAIKIA